MATEVDEVVTRGYSLPRDTYSRLLKEAERQQRNASNMIAVILTDYFLRIDLEREISARQPAKA